MWEKISDQFNVALQQGNIGWLCRHRLRWYNPPLAERVSANLSHSVWKSAINHSSVEMLGHLAELYEREERWQDCMTYLKKYHAVKDRNAHHKAQNRRRAYRTSKAVQYRTSRQKPWKMYS